MADSHSIVTDPFTRTLIKIKAAQLCRRSDFSRSDYDDLRQSMALYLLEKAHLFDPDKGTMEAFVTNALNTWVGMELRFRARQKRCDGYGAVSLEGTTVEFDGETSTLDVLLHESDLERRTGRCSTSPFEVIDRDEAVHHAFSKLSPEEQELLKHVAEHGVSSAAREWSRRTGRDVSRRQIDNAIALMRVRFEEAGLGNGDFCATG
jgi:hypothetical protein